MAFNKLKVHPLSKFWFQMCQHAPLHLEWLSFLHRYIPLELLEVKPAGIHQRPPAYVGRNDLETLLSSNQAEDWVGGPLCGANLTLA